MNNYRYLLSLFLVALLISACGQTPEARRAGEEADIYHVLYETGENDMAQPVVFEENTTLVTSSNPNMNFVKEEIPEISHEMISDFRTVNKRVYPIGDVVRLKREVLTFPADEIKLVVQSEDGSGWKAFYEKYRTTSGINSVSRPGFNTDYDKAILYMGAQYDTHAGGGYLIYMEKVDGQWLVKQSIILWIA